LHAYKTSGKVATFGNNVNNNGNYIVLGGTVSNKNWVLANNMIIGGEFGVGRTSANGGTTIGSAYDLMIDTNGGVKVANTLGVGYTTPSASGAGITFPATQSASSDANTLDDYEEGSWTPTVVGSSTAGTYTVVPIGCVYTKIGRMVALQFNIQFSAASGGSGQAVIGNLPFAMSNSGLAAPGALTARFLNTTASTSNGLSAMRTSGNAGVTDFGMVLVIDNANWEIISISAINTSTEIVGQLTYIA
jgi:hypothetical protein